MRRGATHTHRAGGSGLAARRLGEWAALPWTAAILLLGCATDEPARAPNALEALVAPAPVAAIASLEPLGSVPYDGLVLPLLSPDATFAATHYGAAPGWSTILGAPGAVAPEFTAVRVYALAQRGAKAVATVTEAVVLGRGTDAEGFLVEAPREDGSRWIGRVPWTGPSTTAPTWLVEDDHVNALATLGPDGTLAWCRRAQGQDRFSIVLRRGNRVAVVPRSGDESWLLPSFSADGARLFALVLRGKELLMASTLVGSLEWRDAMAPEDGTAEDAYPPVILSRRETQEFAVDAADGGPDQPSAGPVTDASDVIEPASRLTTIDGVQFQSLASGCTVETAWQCLAFAQSWPVEAARPQDMFVVFHPKQRRVALWRVNDGSVVLMPTGSLAGAFLDPQTIVLALPARTVVQGLAISSEGRTGTPPRPLAEGLHLPRGTSDHERPIVLLSPQRGDVRLAAVRTAAR